MPSFEGESGICRLWFQCRLYDRTGTIDSLEELKQADRTFDFFFIDADKENYNVLRICYSVVQAWIIDCWG